MTNSQGDPFIEGTLHVVAVGREIVCYGEKPDYHDALGAGGVRILRGTRIAAVVFGTSRELPIEGELKAAIDADVAKRAWKHHE